MKYKLYSSYVSTKICALFLFFFISAAREKKHKELVYKPTSRLQVSKGTFVHKHSQSGRGWVEGEGIVRLFLFNSPS